MAAGEVCGIVEKSVPLSPLGALLSERRLTAVQEDCLCEILVKDTQNQEWQGVVRFPATGEELPFASLLELLDVMERHLPS